MITYFDMISQVQ